ncbi:MAG: 50S ribosomal protein L25 [Acidimicrobiales bacterium]
MSQAEVVAEVKSATGSADSRRLRREGRVPGVLYGKGVEATPVSCDARDLRIAMANRIAKGALVTLVINGKKQLAQVQDVQRHPVRREVAHVDFLAMSATETITASIGLEAGTNVELAVNAIEVSGTFSQIPQSIAVEAAGADDEGVILASSITLPSGLTLITDGETVVARLSEDA